MHEILEKGGVSLGYSTLTRLVRKLKLGQPEEKR
mgnify:CR=1 FL=1